MKKISRVALLLSGLLPITAVWAHDPVFGVGPHVLYKGGIEVHAGVHREKAGDERASEAELELNYGITGDWVAGVALPYLRVDDHDHTETGRGSTQLSTKYRFWRNDMPGAQESAAVLGKVIFSDGKVEHHGGGEREDNDYLLGLTYGYEGRKWYRWASVRHRFNDDARNGVERPNVWLLDLVGGIRPTPTEYLEPDWVWMLELNGEIAEHVDNSVGGEAHRRGGSQWFLSPGLMWTYRNFALKTGLQFSVYEDLEDEVNARDYQALVEFEWHL